jgi:hypothetical protein
LVKLSLSSASHVATKELHELGERNDVPEEIICLFGTYHLAAVGESLPHGAFAVQHSEGDEIFTGAKNLHEITEGDVTTRCREACVARPTATAGKHAASNILQFGCGQ